MSKATAWVGCRAGWQGTLCMGGFCWGPPSGTWDGFGVPKWFPAVLRALASRCYAAGSCILLLLASCCQVHDDPGVTPSAASWLW